MPVEDFGLAGRLLIHDPLQHVVRLLVYQTEIFGGEESGRSTMKVNDQYRYVEVCGFQHWFFVYYSVT